MEFYQFKKHIEALSLGKRLPDAIYLHQSALSLVSDGLKQFTLRLIEQHGTDADWNVVKFFRRDFKVSLLFYPDFLNASYPTLRNSLTIDLVRKKTRRTDYSKSENPPILHRKETLVSPEHPSYSEFMAVTKEGEALGLYEKSTRIGFKKSWDRLISNKGYRLIDGRLVAKASIAADAELEEPDSIQIQRHRTAIVRDGLSAPMQSLQSGQFYTWQI